MVNIVCLIGIIGKRVATVNTGSWRSLSHSMVITTDTYTCNCSSNGTQGRSPGNRSLYVPSTTSTWGKINAVDVSLLTRRLAQALVRSLQNGGAAGGISQT